MLLSVDDDNRAVPRRAPVPESVGSPEGTRALESQGDNRGLSTGEAQTLNSAAVPLKNIVQIRIKISDSFH